MKAVRLWWAYRQLHSKKPRRICKAARKLGAARQPKAVFPLASLLKHPAAAVREAAARALADIGNEEAIVPLVMALGDEEQESSRAVKEALVGFGDKAVPHLIATAKSNNDALRAGAVAALGLTGDPNAVPPLIEALADRVPRVRSAAAVALGRANDERAIMPLLLSLNDDHRECRAAAEEALVRYGSLASPHLLEVLQHGNETVRTSAIKALGAMKDYSATAALSAALEDSSPAIRHAALVALGKIGDRSVVPRLREHLDDDDRDFRSQAFDALEDLARLAVSHRDWSAAIDCRAGAVRPVIEAVFAQLQDLQREKVADQTPPAWIPQALDSLVAIGDIKAIPFLLKLVAERLVSENALLALERWLKASPVDFSDEQLRELASLENVTAIAQQGRDHKTCDCSRINELARTELRARSDPERGKARHRPAVTTAPDTAREAAGSQAAQAAVQAAAPQQIGPKTPRIRIHDDIHVKLPHDAPACSLCKRPTYSGDDPAVRLFISEGRLEDRAFIRRARKSFWMMEGLHCPKCDRQFCWECAVAHVHKSGAPSPGDGMEWCPGCAAKIPVRASHRQRPEQLLSPAQIATTVGLLLDVRNTSEPLDEIAFAVGSRLAAAGWNGVDAYLGRLYAGTAAKMLADGTLTDEQLRAKVKV